MSSKRKPAANTEAAIALQQSEARLRLMINAVPAMITYLDTRERYLFCNQPYMDMLGLADDQLLGRSLTWTSITSRISTTRVDMPSVTGC